MYTTMNLICIGMLKVLDLLWFCQSDLNGSIELQWTIWSLYKNLYVYVSSFSLFNENLCMVNTTNNSISLFYTSTVFKHEAFLIFINF